jgi:NhaP-type Na+/H+ or K+/H+ antiporter
MATGVALPKAYLRTELKSLLVLLGPVMIYMWMISGLGVWYFIPGLTFVCCTSLFIFFKKKEYAKQAESEITKSI